MRKRPSSRLALGWDVENGLVKKARLGLVLVALCFLLNGCSEGDRSIKSVIIDFPHGETRLVVWSNGKASLFYGALPQSETIRTGTFDVEELYERLRPRLHRSGPREEWPDPHATYGMVQVKFEDESERDYLIFNERGLAEELFGKAKQNIVGKRP